MRFFSLLMTLLLCCCVIPASNIRAQLGTEQIYNSFINDDPAAPWNDALYRNDPFAPWNDPDYRHDVLAPWNNPMAQKEETNRYFKSLRDTMREAAEEAAEETDQPPIYQGNIFRKYYWK